jgi:hypothetical protein
LVYFKLFGWIANANRFIFAFDPVLQNELVQTEMLTSFRTVGLKSMNFIVNTGNLGQLMALFWIRFLVYGMLGQAVLHYWDHAKVRTKSEATLKGSRWGPVLGFCINGFIPLCISTNLAMRNPADSRSGEVISMIWMAFHGSILYIWFPMTMAKVIRATPEQLADPKFKGMYGPIINPVRMDNRWTRAHFAVFIARRFILIMTAFQFWRSPGL